MLKAEIAHALEKEVDSLQTRLRIEGAKFDQWRRRNVALLLTAGGVAGGMTLAILATVYVRSHPQIIDYSIAWLAKVEFDATSSYDVRKRTYMALPEPQISVSSLEAQILASLTDGAGEKDEDESGSKLALAWASMTSKAFAAVDGSSLLATKAAMRKELVEEIRGRDAATAAAAGTADAAAAAAIARKLAELRDLLPLSLERNIYVTEELSKYMDDHAADGRWIPAEVLEANRPQHPAQPADVSISLLQSVISFFPGPINKLLLFLDEQLPAEDVARALLYPAAAASSQSAQPVPSAATVTGEAQPPAAEGAADAAAVVTDVDQPLQTTVAALETVASHYRSLHHTIQQHVLQSSLAATIAMLTSPEFLKGAAGPRPYQLYQKAIETDLLGPLRRDAQIPEEILLQVKQIFLALPSRIQARILLTAVQHPAARTSWASPSETEANVTGDGDGDGIESSSNDEDEATHNREATAQMVRDLLSAGGVVAVKLAQVIAEDPRVPEPYSTLLGTLRDDNTPMSLATFYHNLPTAIRGRLSHMGPCLGTGSVKQVHAARFKDGGLLLGAGQQQRQRQLAAGADAEAKEEEEQPPLPPVAVAVLRRNVEDEALASLSALEASAELAPVAPRLGQLVYGEFNLFEEGEALKEFAATAIGTHELFHVVQVVHNSPRCLIEEIASGPTLAKLLAETEDSPAAQSRREAALRTLTTFHRTVLKAFIDDGLIHSDIHLGNMAVDDGRRHGSVATVTAAGGGAGGSDKEALRTILTDPKQGVVSETEPAVEPLSFVLFDVGQFVRVGPADTKALLWALGWISTPHRRNTLRSVAVKHLVATSTLSSAAAAEVIAHVQGRLPPAAVLDEGLLAAALSSRIEAAFEIAVLPDEDGNVREQKPAWLRFLRECEARGVLLPKGAFAVSKMMDSIISQQVTYGLPPVLDDAIEDYIMANMTWAEWSVIAKRTVQQKKVFAKDSSQQTAAAGAAGSK